MTRLTRKVLVYLTRGTELLVFTHPFHPDAGIQVPAGTIEPGETPEDAARREVEEETGLSNVAFRARLGTCEHPMHALGRDEIQHRCVFHATVEGPAPERWRHFESQSATQREPIALDLFWHDLRRGPIELAAGQDALLPVLLERLAPQP